MKKYIEKVALMLGLYEGYLRKEKRLVRKVLQKVDKNSLHDRTFNCWDQKFIELVPVLHLYDEALNVLENYGGLRETYFANLLTTNVNNIAFQRKLCKVDNNNHICYGNLLYGFLLRWDFCDELKAELKNDKNMKDIVYFYNNMARLYVANREHL